MSKADVLPVFKVGDLVQWSKRTAWTRTWNRGAVTAVSPRHALTVTPVHHHLESVKFRRSATGRYDCEHVPASTIAQEEWLAARPTTPLCHVGLGLYGGTGEPRIHFPNPTELTLENLDRVIAELGAIRAWLTARPKRIA